MPFRAPTRVHIQSGIADRVGEVVAGLGCRRVLLVTDPGLRATPHPVRVLARLADAGVTAELFDTVEPNPRLGTAMAAAARARDIGAEAVVGLGGGSAIDCGKAAAMLARNEGDPRRYVGRNRFTEPALPFVAVPTTCGTGSEVTWVAVLTDQEARTKVSLKGDAMFPAVALVDPDLLATLPRPVLAATALDAFTHALEATTVTCRNPVSDALAEAAIDLLFAHVPDAFAGRVEAHAPVMRAATLAGMAFGSADVGAVHCLSEAMGGMFDVPHGVANAALLVPVFVAHGASVAGRLAELDRRGPDAFLARVAGLVRAVGIPAFADLGLPEAADAAIAQAAEANGSNGSNPRPMRAADYLAILRAARG